MGPNLAAAEQMTVPDFTPLLQHRGGVVARTFNSFFLPFRCCSVLTGCFHCFCKENRPLFLDMFIVAAVPPLLRVGFVSPLLTIRRVRSRISSSLFLWALASYGP